MLLADQKVRDVTTPVEGREDGTEARFQWNRTVTRLPMPELESGARPNRWGIFEIDVRVTWDEHREVQLATLRTVLIDASGRAAQPSTQTTTGPPATPAPPATPGQPVTPRR
jgi:hypothetical protein